MSSTRREPRSRPETLERRREILRAAMATFGAKGYNKGPLTEIAEQVNMTHAGILHHFGSKNQLLLEVLRYRDESDVAELAEQHIPDGVDLFRHLVRTAFLNADRAGIVQAYAVLSAESVTDDHPARSFFEERYRTLRTEVVEAFRVLCAERGVEAPETVERAAASILAVMDGLQVQWLLDPTAVDLGEASAFAIEAIVAQVLDPRATPVGDTAADEGPGADAPTGQGATT
ncbi:TetR family transcriptional regulator [Xylanimonas oleitrophica]|uniref:TetR family transcriptional regulator n=1 Tax=Xylanimonas oleitrophica TaxID=2607479 RepID=A0A2W5X3R2_9MICO|nr:TetR/AcrR family transcriptional regulator [Xylanimonas oleitrophica]PZR55045.1 TetR family transcriptional regulator [Xylanimonas oleitrophica]